MFQNPFLVRMLGEEINSQKELFIYFACMCMCFLVSYLLGSINSGIIVSRIFYSDDVRNHGSGNAGLTNMYRTYGKRAAALTLAGDMLKVFISLLFCAFFFGFLYKSGLSYQPVCYLSAFFCQLGHIKPIFYKFKGGKGVLCAAAAILLLAPFVFLVLLLVFISLVSMTKYISVGSIAIAFFLPFTIRANMSILGATDPIITGFCAIIGLTVIICHRSNIKRLQKGTESKFYFNQKNKPTDDKLNEE